MYVKKFENNSMQNNYCANKASPSFIPSLFQVLFQENV